MCSPDAHRKLLQALLGKSSRDRMSPKMSFQRHDFYKFWHLQFEVFVRFVETRNSRFLQEFSASPRLFWSHSAQPWIRHWSFRNGHGGVCLINLKHNLQWWSWCSSWVQNISLLGTRGFLKQNSNQAAASRVARKRNKSQKWSNCFENSGLTTEKLHV